jgi:hypothetical protein
MNSRIPYRMPVGLLMPVFLFICTIMVYFPAGAQEKPPVPIEVTVSLVQNLNFGAFCFGDGSGTTVIISSEGMRSSTGNILLLSSGFSAALFDVEAIPGTLITIVNGPDATLTGSNGGTLTLKIGDSYPQSPLITTGEHTWVTIGGTLIVGSSITNPPGSYSGFFSVTYIQQ